MRGARLALGLLASAGALPAWDGDGGTHVARPAPRPGRLLLVSTEAPTDAGILAALRPTRGERVELRLAPGGGAPSATEPPGGAGDGIVILRPGERRAADERALEARLAAAGTIVLRGGDLLAWGAALNPRDHPTAAWRGILGGIRAGADVVGLGGGAAYLAGASLVARDGLAGPRRNPRERRPFVLAVGMGLGPPGIVEVEARGDEHALRLLLELTETRASVGFRLEGEAALRVDYLRGRVEILGPGCALAFDTRGAREDRGLVRGARLSLLRAGDAWEIGHRRARPGEGQATGVAAGEPGAAERRRVESLEGGLAAQLAPLEQGRGLVLGGPFGRMEVGLDARTRSWDGANGTSFADLTLSWRAPDSPAPPAR